MQLKQKNAIKNEEYTRLTYTKKRGPSLLGAPLPLPKTEFIIRNEDIYIVNNI